MFELKARYFISNVLLTKVQAKRFY